MDYFTPTPVQLKRFGEPLEVEMKRTLFASVVEVRFGVWNTNCWDLLRKPYLHPLTVHWTVKPSQPLRWDGDTNFEKRGWTFCPASIWLEVSSCSLFLSSCDIIKWLEISKTKGRNKDNQCLQICVGSWLNMTTCLMIHLKPNVVLWFTSLYINYVRWDVWWNWSSFWRD